MSIAKQQAQPRQPQVGYVLIPAYNILNSNFVSIQQDGHHLWTIDNNKKVVDVFQNSHHLPVDLF